jgi:hypothetical protein
MEPCDACTGRARDPPGEFASARGPANPEPESWTDPVFVRPLERARCRSRGGPALPVTTGTQEPFPPTPNQGTAYDLRSSPMREPHGIQQNPEVGGDASSSRRRFHGDVHRGGLFIARGGASGRTEHALRRPLEFRMHGLGHRDPRGPFCTLHAAADAAEPGDLVSVAPGSRRLGHPARVHRHHPGLDQFHGPLPRLRLRRHNHHLGRHHPGTERVLVDSGTESGVPQFVACSSVGWRQSARSAGCG